MKKIYILTILGVLLLLSVIPLMAHEKPLTAQGVLYYMKDFDECGGIIHIYGGKKLLKLSNNEAMQNRFYDFDNLEYGGIWEIKYHKDTGGLVLDDAFFTGQFDSVARNSTALIWSYFQNILWDDYQMAYS